MNKILLAALTLFACMSMYANEKVVAKLSTAPASAGVMTADRAVTYTLKIYEGNADASVPSNLIYTKDYPVTETMTWVNLPINNIVAIDHSKSLWVSLGTNEGSFPAAVCSEELTTTDCCMFFISGSWMPVNMIGSYPLRPWMIVANTTSETPGFDCTPITEFPYFNDFENFPDEKDCWVSIDNDGDGHDWFTATERYWNAAEQGVDISGVDGSHCIISESYYDGAVLTSDNYILSPELALPATNDVILLSWYAAAQDPEWPDSYEVMLAPNGSSEINDFVSVYAGTGDLEWTEHSTDISEYAGTTVRVVFHHQESDMFYIKIDNLSVKISGTGVDENNSEKVAVYPNPVKDVLNLRGIENGAEVRIYDLTGSEVMSFVYEGQNINIGNLANGVYVLRTGDNRIKFVK